MGGYFYRKPLSAHFLFPSFFMDSLSIYSSKQPDCAGLSLRGSCLSNENIQQLEQALSRLNLVAGKSLWIDCRYLEKVNYQGQRVLLWLDTHARTQGLTLYWCGFPAEVLTQLHESGLALLLRLVPAGAYKGPTNLLAATMEADNRPALRV